MLCQEAGEQAAEGSHAEELAGVDAHDAAAQIVGVGMAVSIA